MANATRAGTTLLRSCLCRSAVAVRPFAHLRILYVGPGCKSGPAGFKAGQAFTAVYNRANRLYSRPARFKTGRPAIKPAAGFQAGQVYNRALTWPLRNFVVWPLRNFVVWPLRNFVVWPLRNFVVWPLRNFVVWTHVIL